jgi:uncharacterized protein (DUF2384 family)
MSVIGFTDADVQTINLVDPSAGTVWMGQPRYLKIATSELTSSAFSNYKHLVDRAVDVFGDEITASTWLSTPNNDLDGQVPLQVAQRSDYDPEVLEPIFVKLEHGIYF